MCSWGVDPVMLKIVPPSAPEQTTAPEAAGPGKEDETDDRIRVWARVFPPLNARNYAVAFALIAALLLLAVGLAHLPLALYTNDDALVQVVVRQTDGRPLLLEVDDQLFLQTGGQTTIFEQVPVTPGEHHLRLFLDGGRVLFDDVVTVEGRQVFELTF